MIKTTTKHVYTDKATGRAYEIPTETSSDLMARARIERADDGTITKIVYMVPDDDPYLDFSVFGGGNDYWKLGTSSRHDKKEFHEVYQAALGLDSDWQPRLHALHKVAVKALEKWAATGEPHLPIVVSAKEMLDGMEDVTTLGAAVVGTIKKKLLEGGVQATCNHTLLEMLGEIADEAAHDDLAGAVASLEKVQGGYKYLTTKKARELLPMATEAMATMINPYTIMLSVYDHGGRHYSLFGEGINCRFDTAHGGAVLVPTEEFMQTAIGIAEINGKEVKEVLMTFAKGVLEEMNAIEDGDCYGIVSQTYTDGIADDDHDSCWGFVGYDATVEAMKEF